MRTQHGLVYVVFCIVALISDAVCYLCGYGCLFIISNNNNSIIYLFNKYPKVEEKLSKM